MHLTADVDTREERDDKVPDLAHKFHKPTQENNNIVSNYLGWNISTQNISQPAHITIFSQRYNHYYFGITY